MALDGGGTAWVPPPIPSSSKLLTTPNQCLSLLVPLAPFGKSLVMILATSGINGNSHGCGSPTFPSTTRVSLRSSSRADPGLGLNPIPCLPLGANLSEALDPLNQFLELG